MTLALAAVPPRPSLPRRFLDGGIGPVVVVVLAIVAVWYVAAIILNTPRTSDVFENAGDDIP